MFSNLEGSSKNQPVNYSQEISHSLDASVSLLSRFASYNVNTRVQYLPLTKFMSNQGIIEK